MSVIPASVKCDGCGKNRQEDGNHWLSLSISGVQDSFKVIEFRTGIVLDYYAHVCGSSCASKLFARWLSTGKLDET